MKYRSEAPYWWHADDVALLEESCQLAPAAGNPYSEHPLPLQAAQQMEARGRLGGAALAYEAAARVLALSSYHGRALLDMLDS